MSLNDDKIEGVPFGPRKQYKVKDIFPTIQGEGYWAGTPCVFVRLSGCNMWDGVEAHRHRDAKRNGALCATFCDTEFTGGHKFTAQGLGMIISKKFPNAKFIVLTGGEPALQLDEELLRALRMIGSGPGARYVSMETNGSVPLKARPDWVTVSPKTSDWVVIPNELKVVCPSYNPLAALERLKELVSVEVDTPPEVKLFVQPEDGPEVKTNTLRCIDWVQEHPEWRLSIQTHKILNLP